jgi:hypothetical protein
VAGPPARPLIVGSSGLARLSLPRGVIVIVSVVGE